MGDGTLTLVGSAGGRRPKKGDYGVGTECGRDYKFCCFENKKKRHKKWGEGVGKVKKNGVGGGQRHANLCNRGRRRIFTKKNVQGGKKAGGGLHSSNDINRWTGGQNEVLSML